MRAAVAVALLSACTVGPKYARPPVETPPAFKETWQPARPQDGSLKGNWWTMFREPELDALEAELCVHNQNIAQAFEVYMAARALLAQARAQFFPTLTLAPSYQVFGGGSGSRGARTGLGGTIGGNGASIGGIGGSNIIQIYSVPLDASWAPDLWGRVRNTVRQNRSAAQARAADLENVRLVQQAMLAQLYFQLRGQDALQEVYNDTVLAYRQSLELTRTLYATGIDSAEAVAQADVQLKTAEAQAAGIAINRAIDEHAIATLIGKPASSFSLPVHALRTLVPAIPVGIPSRLLERRPDIAAAERTMEQANAAIGIAKAAYFPTLTLTGSGGTQSTDFTSLFSVPTLFWSIGATASELIFDGGQRRATALQFTASYRANVAAYRQTVLSAFQQVEDSTATLRILAEEITRQWTAVEAAQRNLTLAQDRYKTGLDPYLNVLTAQTLLLTNQQTLVTLRVNQMVAAVLLVQALGGGWDVSKLPRDL